jgi:hypothetical protein
MTMNPGCPVSVSGNLIKNGSFEEPKVTPPFAQQNLSFTSWNLSAGNVDIVENSHWQAGQGVQSLDLNGIDAGSLSQTVITSIPTKLYALRFRLSFCLAANPGGSEPAKLELIWNNTSMGIFTFDAQSQSAADMGWVNYTGVQTLPAGRRSVNTLVFRSLNTGSAGPVIDNVSLLLEN